MFSGTTGVGAEVTPDVVYSMAETSVPGYSQVVDEGAVIIPPATGSWNCSNQLTRSGPISRTVYDGSQGQVTVGIGQITQCTARNTAQAATLTLRKSLHNEFGGTATNRDWLLQAVPGSSENEPAPISGRDGDAGVTGAVAFPGVPYRLSENNGPGGYRESDVVHCVLTGTANELPTADGVLTPDLGQDITCTFTNSDISPTLTLLKEVGGGPAPATDWILNATPATGSGSTQITGRSGSAAVTNVPARSNVRYTLTESAGPAGYVEAAPTCVLTGTATAVQVVDTAVALGPGQDVTCTFHNRFSGRLPATGTRLTGLIRAGGTAILLGAWLLLVTSVRRKRPVTNAS